MIIFISIFFIFMSLIIFYVSLHNQLDLTGFFISLFILIMSLILIIPRFSINYNFPSFLSKVDLFFIEKNKAKMFSLSLGICSYLYAILIAFDPSPMNKSGRFSALKIWLSELTGYDGQMVLFIITGSILILSALKKD